MAPDPLLYTPEEAAAALRIGRTRMYQLIADGSIASIKLGASRRITRRALDGFIRALDGSPAVTARRQRDDLAPPRRPSRRLAGDVAAMRLPLDRE